MSQPPISNIAVCIATYGDYSHWSKMVDAHAYPSAERQTVRPAAIRWIHGSTLHDARNEAAEDVARRRTAKAVEWLCFLDADDELDPHYIEAMSAALTDRKGDWLLQPATLGVHPDGREDPYPVVIPPKPLLDGNFMVIGTLIRRDQFLRLGGFADWAYCEDWDLWIRAWRDGAGLEPVPEAIYRVHVNPNSRNNGDRATQVRIYNQIRSQYAGGRR
jgi:GT2 family glycosyltransferase